nr:iron-containing alcohol dehydrogenase [uncultured Oscillibacter sp.]
MKFQYHNPIQFSFGPNALDQLPEICRGKKVLLVYGGGSIKKNGVYDRITTLLREAGIAYLDYGGQTAATWQGVQDGIALARREDTGAVVEIGGASAMDTGKAIAFGAVHDHLEDYIEGRVQSDGRHLLNIVIPTYPSTGSEANGVCDIMEYKGYGTELFGAWPDHCLMDPSVTLSLNKRSTVYSVLGCFVQTGAWFLGNHENDIAKGFAKTVLRVLLESCEALLRDPKDLRARGNVMWASCVNTMGVFRSGVDQSYPWTVFSVGYIPRAAHRVPYREALVIAYLHWLKGAAKYHMADIRALFTEVFGVDAALEDAAIVEAGCSRLRALMEAGGVDTTLAPYGACPTMDYVKKSLAKEDYGEFTPEELYGMIAACYA